MSEIKDNTSNEPTEYTVTQKAHEEAWKTLYDLFKHLTTLCTGSILLFVAFLEKVFSQPKWKLFVGVAFGAFILSIIASLMLMLLISGFIRNLGKTEDFEEVHTILRVGFFIAICSFLVGITCLIVFAIKNLYA